MKHIHYLLGLSLLGWWASACNPNPGGLPLFHLRTPEETGIDFSNQLTPNDSLNIIQFRYFYNGGGVAVGDFNKDGLNDVFFTGNMVSSKMYLNRGGWKFEDITEKAGIATNFWATGVSLVDINRDGWLDVYICASGLGEKAARRNRLYVHQGLDADGVPLFLEKAVDYGIADAGYTTHAAFFDYDRDGDTDMYLLTAANNDFYGNDIRRPVSDGQGVTTDKLYRNNGDATFTDVSKEAGISLEGFGLGVAIHDFNQDGWPDIYVSNDYLSGDLLYINQGLKDGKHIGFAEQSQDYLDHQSHFSMGTDVADLNRDGLAEIVTLDMMPEHYEGKRMMAGSMNYDRFHMALKRGYPAQYMRNMLQWNMGNSPNGHPTFAEIGRLAGIHQTDWSWAPLIADFDHDGQRDLYITNGYGKDITNHDFAVYDMPEAFNIGDPKARERRIAEIYRELPPLKRSNYAYQQANNFQFKNATRSWGLETPSFSNGVAYADFDNDGDLDLVVNNLDEEAFLFENRSSQIHPERHWLRIRLEAGNRFPISTGAVVGVLAGGVKQTSTHYIYRGYQSTVAPELHVGLGDAARIEEIVVKWPDGHVQRLADLPADTLLTITYEPTADLPELDAPQEKNTPLLLSSSTALPAFKHKKSGFIDFKYQPLLPHLLSRMGPALAVADVNGDGLEDFYTSATIGQAGQVWIQNATGNFQPTPLGTDKREEGGALFFDVDGDNDTDLYTVGSGQAYGSESPFYQDHLWLNDGSGNFTLSLERLPEINQSGTCVKAADYDRDGDLDVFVGGGAVPGRYPQPSRSYLLVNEDGVLVDKTAALAPKLAYVGIVNDALWSDADGDGLVDLVVVGEWMRPTILKNERRRLVLLEVGNPSSNPLASGWWNSLAGADFDRDGDVDYVLGNWGMNHPFGVDEAHPMQLYADDFDQNGSYDALMAYFQADGSGKKQLFPYHSRDVLVDQILSIRKRFPRYLDYAQADFETVLPPGKRQNALFKEVKELASGVLENMGGGEFRFHPFPWQAQVSPLFALLPLDLDRDGWTDLAAVGNFYGADMGTGRFDALKGLVLKNKGNWEWEALNPSESGFWVPGDARSLVALRTSGQQLHLLAGVNGEAMRAFAMEAALPARIPLRPLDARAAIEWADGTNSVEEFYYGHSYFSQQQRQFLLHPDMKKITIIDFQGGERTLSLTQ